MNADDKPLVMYWCAGLFTEWREEGFYIHIIPVTEEDYAELDHLADLSVPFDDGKTIHGLNVRMINLRQDQIGVLELAVLDQAKEKIISIFNSSEVKATSLRYRYAMDTNNEPF